MTPHAGDLILRDTGPTSLERVERAIASVRGVTSCRAVLRRDASGRPFIIGLVSAQVDEAITPEVVLEAVRKAWPKPHWPDQVIVAYIEGEQARRRRAA
ncbi:MAG: hypothetical protein KatS3mg015_1880 [Fimbriimonadales bacterium]|nr:MAG: hypothetical protein KatS3mg015_1880 [Fimbriimonadales bacterium]